MLWVTEDILLNNKNMNININKLEAKCTHLSDTEKKTQKAERDSIKYMQTLYMSERIGKVYVGVVTSVLEHMVFVEVKENFCEGMIRISDIIGDTFVADVKNYCVKGYNTGEIIRLGDEVNILVHSVDLEKKNINFELIKI